ncbi:hypothetical protein FKP32DRAFT_1289095 [Trametes sanguinea]|nr:hypothetical protein FKP32DRAFT_1289095 [Trametes sanguinea]
MMIELARCVGVGGKAAFGEVSPETPLARKRLGAYCAFSSSKSVIIRCYSTGFIYLHGFGILYGHRRRSVVKLRRIMELARTHRRFTIATRSSRGFLHPGLSPCHLDMRRSAERRLCC